MATTPPDLRGFFNRMIHASPLGSSQGLGFGPNNNPNSPVGASGGGEALRAMWGILRPPEGANAGQIARTDTINAAAPGSIVSKLFNQDAFPQLMPHRPSPFPQPVTTPVPAKQFATDPEPTIPSAPNRPDEPRNRPGVEEPSDMVKPPDPRTIGRDRVTREQLAAWNAWVKAHPEDEVAPAQREVFGR